MCYSSGSIARRYFSRYTSIPYDPDVEFNSQLLQNSSYLSVSLLNPLITAITAGLLLIFSIELGFTKRQAAAISLVFGILSPAAVYAKFDFSQPLASLFLLLALFLINRALTRLTIGYWAAAGFSLSLAGLARTEMNLLLYPIIVLVIAFRSKSLSSRSGVNWFWILLAFTVPVFIMIAINQSRNETATG